ncbi:hypothetical protein ASPVEDRAFT_62986 [Aspergillus versicolor CBS 583.65]|uniref:Pyoverdine/dityrosine biosynthesis protein n=1 Tax=Aspergillus versicolor CBS 583.65 TaxID=1036611 RepID=A0A1L9PNR9_ASPVE|nr:uncharacterized protein ASPVEDRAFT_62986 [Aspergillus versicolor CBS 583.65]OJJ03174.1 hypothetical protein ASPVEDRAFT_62986 [Aspergillus versicolor CBS 583.65]
MSINYGSSVYHHVAGVYQRDQSGRLLVAEGRYAKQIRSFWSDISNVALKGETTERTELSSGKAVNSTQTTLPFNIQRDQSEQTQTFQIHELLEPDSDDVRGLITSEPSSFLQPVFFNWAKTFLLLNARMLTTGVSFDSINIEALKIADQVADLFESIKNTSQDDKWSTEGRQYFINKVYSFTKDSRHIELCLPAFPCKSSNPEKVAGVSPDAAEYLALNHLHSFVEQVSKIYTPGATLWIISDGHVFSDCIGVDDSLVDEYGQTLEIEYRRRQESTGNGYIKFTGLEDLFFSSLETTAAFSTDMLTDVEIPQPIETIRTDSAQKCRLLLEKVGGIDRDHLRQLITDKHHDTLALYQGQSRFMLEDLASYLSARNMGGKQKKRVASSVAAEMIARNHAYSNLVELLFPHHIRLSIHAHSNCGPKFGIRLFPKGTVRPVLDAQSLLSTTESSKSTYEFQIPTAWHNCLAKVDESETMLLTRSGIIRDAIRKGIFSGSWCEDTNGGYFAVKRIQDKSEEQTGQEVALREPRPEPLKSPLSVFGLFVWSRLMGMWAAFRTVVRWS